MCRPMGLMKVWRGVFRDALERSGGQYCSLLQAPAGEQRHKELTLPQETDAEDEGGYAHKQRAGMRRISPRLLRAPSIPLDRTERRRWRISRESMKASRK